MTLVLLVGACAGAPAPSPQPSYAPCEVYDHHTRPSLRRMDRALSEFSDGKISRSALAGVFREEQIYMRAHRPDDAKLGAAHARVIEALGQMAAALDSARGLTEAHAAWQKVVTALEEACPGSGGD